MHKNITIIIKKTQTNIGKYGEIKSVSKGYARNYLIPMKIAEIATKGKIKHIKMLQEKHNQLMEQQLNNSIETQKYLEKMSKIKIRKKVSDKNSQQIFGSITEKEISEKIFKLTGINIERKQIFIPVIKNIGNYIIQVKITSNINANLKLQVLPDII